MVKKLKKSKKITPLPQPIKNVNSAADIIFTAGIDGSIRFRTNDGKELLELGTDYVAVLGEILNFGQLKKLIQSFKETEDNCCCSAQQLLIQGCSCGKI